MLCFLTHTIQSMKQQTPISKRYSFEKALYRWQKNLTLAFMVWQDGEDLSLGCNVAPRAGECNVQRGDLGGGERWYTLALRAG